VPFFVYGGTALVKGRGEIVFPLPLAGTFHYVLVAPPVAVPTANIYRNLKIHLTKRPRDVNLIIQEFFQRYMNYHKIAKQLFNRLEPVALGLYPPLANTFQSFQRMVSSGVLLSGSGSTIFKLCPNKAEAEKIARLISGRLPGRIFVAKSLS